jgi:Zn-dependent protease with chaperone function
MNELLFPALGSAVVMLLVLPLCAAISKLLLRLLDLAAGSRFLRWGALRYLLLVLPSIVPLAWTLSAGLHQAESGRSVLGCIFMHELEELCLEPLLFAGLLGIVALGCAGPWLLRFSSISNVADGGDATITARLSALVAETPGLRALRGRVVVSDGRVGGSAVLGLWRPIVAVDADFVNACDDETLVGALAHELEHLRGGDGLRYWLLALALRLNPLGSWLLKREAAAWVFSREVQCDRAAVLAGAEPLAVASALLRAASPRDAALAHIGAARSKLGLRVELLLAYSEKRPASEAGLGAVGLVLLGLLAFAASIFPHVGGTDPLDVMHTTVERVARHLVE